MTVPTVVVGGLDSSQADHLQRKLPGLKIVPLIRDDKTPDKLPKGDFIVLTRQASPHLRRLAMRDAAGRWEQAGGSVSSVADFLQRRYADILRPDAKAEVKAAVPTSTPTPTKGKEEIMKLKIDEMPDIETLKEKEEAEPTLTTESGKYFDGHVPEKEELVDVLSQTGGLALKSETKVVLNHKLAEQLLEMGEFSQERPLQDTWVTYLIGCMKRGTWRPEWVQLAKCFCKEDGKTYRMNGQHSCWSALSMPQDWSAKVTMHSYEAETLADVRLLYANIDGGKKRSRAHVLNAYLGDSDTFKDVSNSNIKRVIAGFEVWSNPATMKSGRSRGRLDPHAVAALATGEHAALTARVSAYVQMIPREASFMRKASVVGAMYATFEKAVKASEEFWNTVRDGVGLTDKLDPRLQLRNRLQRARVAVSCGTGAGDLVSPEALYRLCLHAWNCWRSGEMPTYMKAQVIGERVKVK